MQAAGVRLLPSSQQQQVARAAEHDVDLQDVAATASALSAVASAALPPALAAAMAHRVEAVAAARARSRSASRPRATLTAGITRPRSMSRGRAPPGRRRTMRWLNDHMVHVYSIMYATAAGSGRRGGGGAAGGSVASAHGGGVRGPFSEEELAERLEHVYLTVEHHPLLDDLAVHDGLYRAFRKGTVGAESIASVRAAAARAARASLSVRAQLAAMYVRVDRRMRPHLLREARSALLAALDSMSAAAGGGTEGAPCTCNAEHVVPAAFVADAELVLQHFMDGGGADLPALWEEVVALSAGDGSEAGSRYSGPCASRPVGFHAVMGMAAAPQVGVDTNTRGLPVRTLHVVWADGLKRVLVAALAQFYDVAAATWDGAVEGGAAGGTPAAGSAARHMRLSAPLHPATDLDSVLPDGRPHPHAAVAAARTRLAALAAHGGAGFTLPSAARRSRSRSRRARGEVTVPPAGVSDATSTAAVPPAAAAPPPPAPGPGAVLATGGDVESLGGAVAALSLASSAATLPVPTAPVPGDMTPLPLVPLLLLHVRTLASSGGPPPSAAAAS